jgi:SAM-dependent methyltransferase
MNEEHEFCSSLYGELQSEGACGWFVDISHRALERGTQGLASTSRLLEVGGNLGEHCRYVEHPYSEYLVTDYREVDFVSPDPRIRFEVADVEDLPYEDGRFDRVLATCVLLHLARPEQALREIRRVTAPGGRISLTLPCDPGIAYRLAKLVGPYRSIRRRGAQDNPRYFHYQQHRNHYPGIMAMIEHVFEEDQLSARSWPFPVPTWNFNLFSIVQIHLKN